MKKTFFIVCAAVAFMASMGVLPVQAQTTPSTVEKQAQLVVLLKQVVALLVQLQSQSHGVSSVEVSLPIPAVVIARAGASHIPAATITFSGNTRASLQSVGFSLEGDFATALGMAYLYDGSLLLDEEPISDERHIPLLFNNLGVQIDPFMKKKLSVFVDSTEQARGTVQLFLKSFSIGSLTGETVRSSMKTATDGDRISF